MEEIMGMKPDMTGRKDLGIRRLPQSGAIPVQSKAPTRTSEDNKNAVRGMSKDMAKKMKKVMLANGMIKEAKINPHVVVKGMPTPNKNHNTYVC